MPKQRDDLWLLLGTCRLLKTKLRTVGCRPTIHESSIPCHPFQALCQRHSVVIPVADSAFSSCELRSRRGKTQELCRLCSGRPVSGQSVGHCRTSNAILLASSGLSKHALEAVVLCRVHPCPLAFHLLARDVLTKGKAKDTGEAPTLAD